MDIEEIQQIFRKHWKAGWGSIAPLEVLYVQSLIDRFKPSSFLEVGTASGMSGGLIASLLDEIGGGTFTTIDHDNTFFGDTTKENGFLLPEIYSGSRVSVRMRPFTTALDLASLGDTFDMAFIDANHQHPWPMIDTLCLYPHMTADKTVIHHDLALFKKQKAPIGLGPKYLFDQFPESHRDRSTANGGNIFTVWLSLSRDEVERIAEDAFHLPWTLRVPLQPAHLAKFRAVLNENYSDQLLAAFDECVRRFNRAGS